MSIKNLDLRFPEIYLKEEKPNHSSLQLDKATQLGEDYRNIKKSLKQNTQNKKIISKQFKSIGAKAVETEEQTIKIMAVNERIKSDKFKLKRIESQIHALVTPEVLAEPILPPQFSAKLNDETCRNVKLTIVALDHINQNLWTEYVNSHPNATVYHSLAIKSVIERTFHHESRYLMATSENNQVHGVLPLIHMSSRLFGDFWTSLPYFNYGGVLADNDLVQQQLITYAKLELLTDNCQHMEYRHCHPIDKMPVRNQKVSMILQLPDNIENLWQKLGSKMRAQINKAESNSHHVKIGREELVSDFYRVFSSRMRDLGTPVYTQDLFVNMLSANPGANIFIVYIDNKPSAVGFVIGWRNTLEIPWASTLKQANKFNSNMLLYWHILKFAIQQEYTFFDFGRSSKDASTHQFKKQWGSTEMQLFWHYSLPDGDNLPTLNNNNPKYHLAIKIWQHLPVWLTRIIGPSIVKYIP
jgi:serine/alanine adding enzyme